MKKAVGTLAQRTVNHDVFSTRPEKKHKSKFMDGSGIIVAAYRGANNTKIIIAAHRLNKIRLFCLSDFQKQS